MKKIFFGILLFSSLLSCKREKDELIKEPQMLAEEKLDSNDILLVPYNINDLLVFKDSVGDSIVFRVRSRESSYHTFYTSYVDGVGQSDYYIQQKNETKLISDSITRSSQVIVFAKFPYSSIIENRDKKLAISFALPNDIRANDFIGRMSYDTIGNFINIEDNTPISFFSSYSILSQNYINVYEIPRSYVDLTAPNPIVVIYYNFNQGIVGFKKQDGKTWYLAN